MCEGAVGSVLGAEAPRVRVVDTHAGLVVAEVVAALRVAGGPVEVRAAGREGKGFF